MSEDPSLLLTVTGRDRPGIAGRLFEGLSSFDLVLLDVEQVQVHGRLLLSVEVEGSSGQAAELCEAVRRSLGRLVDDGPDGLVVSAIPLEPGRLPGDEPRVDGHLVTVLGPRLDAVAMGGVCDTIAACGGNVDRVVRLSTYPVTSYELTVSRGDPGRLRRELAAEAVRHEVDVAVQRAGLHRRAKHLIVLDADSTLLQGEVIDLLAAKAGCADAVAAVTVAAMEGDLDFTESLSRRLALVAGADAALLDEVARELTLTPGARTLVRTLKRLGYLTAVVSGGFVQVVGAVTAELGIDYLAANTLEVQGGRLTGRLVGPVVDRAGKAAALKRFASESGVPLSQTIAVGDGANDLDMLAAAGLGIAFNAKPVVRDAADAALNVPYLDAILFLLGIPRKEIEAADGA